MACHGAGERTLLARTGSWLALRVAPLAIVAAGCDGGEVERVDLGAPDGEEREISDA